MVRERGQGLDGECGGGRELVCQPGPGRAALALGTGKFPADLALLKIAGWGRAGVGEPWWGYPAGPWSSPSTTMRLLRGGGERQGLVGGFTLL